MLPVRLEPGVANVDQHSWVCFYLQVECTTLDPNAVFGHTDSNSTCLCAACRDVRLVADQRALGMVPGSRPYSLR